jgi:outer membrane lipoprotein-sorting protein
MGKKTLFLCFLVLLPLLLPGCRAPSEKDLRNRLSKEIANVQSFHALMEIRIATRDSVERYEVEQWYLAPQRFRVDVGLPHGSGQRFITDGVVTNIYEEELKEWFQVDNASEHNPTPPFLLTSYWQNFLDSREMTLLGKEKLEQRTYYRVEVTPRDANAFREKEIFWLDSKTLMPMRIETFDEKGELRAELVFKEITLNPELEGDIFDVEIVS